MAVCQFRILLLSTAGLYRKESKPRLGPLPVTRRSTPRSSRGNTGRVTHTTAVRPVPVAMTVQYGINAHTVQLGILLSSTTPVVNIMPCMRKQPVQQVWQKVLDTYIYLCLAAFRCRGDSPSSRTPAVHRRRSRLPLTVYITREISFMKKKSLP